MDIITFKKKLDNRSFWGLDAQTKDAFEAAGRWADEINNKSETVSRWSWDCGFKLDYDGDICQISSRFYPPHRHCEGCVKYSGEVTLFVLDQEVVTKKIEAETLDELQEKAETYVAHLERKVAISIIAPE